MDDIIDREVQPDLNVDMIRENDTLGKILKPTQNFPRRWKYLLESAVKFLPIFYEILNKNKIKVFDHGEIIYIPCTEAHFIL